MWTPARIGGLAAACLVLIVGVMVYQNYFKMEDAARDDKIAGSDVTISDSTKVESAAEYKDVYAYLENIRKASHNTVMSYHSDLTKMIAYLHGQGMDSVSAVRTTHLNSYVLLLVCSIAVAVMGISLFLNMPAIVSYWSITFMSFTAMGASTLFMVQIYTLVQTQTPPQLVGKIMRR